MKKQPPSHKSIAAATGASRRSVTKWLEEAGLKPTDAGATELCQLKHKKKDVQSPPSDLTQPDLPVGEVGNIDPDSGLTWFKLEQREKAIKLARENRLALKLEEQTYMEVSDHHQILGVIGERLNQMAQRAKSELGLSESQSKRLERLIDEARSSAAEEIKEG